MTRGLSVCGLGRNRFHLCGEFQAVNKLAMAEKITSTCEDGKEKPQLCIDAAGLLASSQETLKRIESCLKTLELRSYHGKRSEAYKALILEANTVCTRSRLRVAAITSQNSEYAVNVPQQSDQW